MTVWKTWLVLLVIAAAAGRTGGQVTLQLKSGQKLVGESILKEDANSLELKICHSYSRTVPKAAVAKREESPTTKPGQVHAAGQPGECVRLSAEQVAAREKLIGRYFADPNQRAKVLAEVRREDAIPRGEVERFRAAIFAAAREGPKLREGDSVFEHPVYRGNVHVELQPRPRPGGAATKPGAAATAPAATRPGDDRYAMVVLLHGGGEGDGNWRSGTGMFMGGFRKQLGKVVFVCPTVLEKHYAEWGSNASEEAYVKELMKAAKRTWPIDTDRVYCAGYSMGGYGTWHYGGHQADVFAGLVSGAGGILLGMRQGETWGWGVLTNLMHTPICALHARDDVPAPVWSDQASDRILGELGRRETGTYSHKYVEYEKGGHGAAARGLGEAIRWATGFTRQSDPRTVAWEPSRPFIRNFYWLQVDRPRFFTRLEGAIRGNTIDLTLTGLSGGFSILLNEHLVDMHKPVTVRCGGKVVFEAPVRPSLSAMLESIADKIDPRMWYWGRIDF